MQVNQVSPDQCWAFGTVAVLTPQHAKPTDPADAHRHDVLPEGRLWLARRTSTTWAVALDATPTFERWVHDAAPAVVSPDEQAILGAAPATANARGDDDCEDEDDCAKESIQVSLPWTTGQAWKLSGGPHA